MAARRTIGNVTASTELLEMAMSFGPSCVLCAAARLGVADALGEAERSASEVATACAADPSSMYRLLRAMAALGLLNETSPQHFRLTALGRPLCKDVPDSAWAAVVFWADLLADFWSRLGECVRTGQSAAKVMEQAGIGSRWSQEPEAGGIFARLWAPAPQRTMRPSSMRGRSRQRCGGRSRRWRRLAHPGGAGTPPRPARHAGGRDPSIEAATARFQSLSLADRCELIAADIPRPCRPAPTSTC